MENQKTILICGATGFIGRNLTEHYSKNNKVVAVYNKRKPNYNHPNVKWIKADLRNPENIKDILNPYFTTKKNGTGLGLSIVNKIIKLYENSENKI